MLAGASRMISEQIGDLIMPFEHTDVRVIRSTIVSLKLALAAVEKSETELWHRRLAHVKPTDVHNVHKHSDGVPALSVFDDVCRSC